MATVGIDIGANVSVVATIGRGNVEIVRNDISERCTPSLVGFTSRERLIGDPALSSFKSNFRNTCRNMKMLLGRVHDPSIADEQRFSFAPLVPCESGLVGYQVTKNGELSTVNATSAMAGLLTGLRETAERSLGQSVAAAVIGVPSWYSDRHCQAMADAAEIAGIRCLRVMSEHAATALDYGIYRSSQFDPKVPHRVLFVNVGYASSSVCIADFIQNQLKIVHVESDPCLGGRDMDELLSRRVASNINARMKLNILENPKARMKIEDAVAKAKKILSANQETTISLESVYNDEDIFETITRDQFVEECGQLRDKLAALLLNAFQKSGGAIVHSIELVGGSTRIPWVQNTILEVSTEALTGAAEEVHLSRTLSQDECVAKGCALQAAMLSPHFKVRDFNVIDIVVHPIAVSWEQHAIAKKIKADGVSPNAYPNPDAVGWNNQLLVSRSTPYPTAKWISFEPTKSFGIRLSYAEPHLLPPSVSEILEEFRVELHEPVKEDDKARIKVGFFVNLNRICCTDAYLAVDEEVEKIVKEKRPKVVSPAAAEAASTTHPSTGTSPATPATPPGTEADGNLPAEGASTKQIEYEYVDVVEKKRVTKRTIIPLTSSMRPGWLTRNKLTELRESEISMINEDRIHKERKEKLNDLESYAYNMRDKLENGALGQFIEPSAKLSFLESINRTTDWIYDEGEQAQKSVLVAKLDELKLIGDKAVQYMRDFEGRDEATQRLLEACRGFRIAASSDDEKFSHITTKADIINESNKLESWLHEEMAKQRAIPLFAEPVLTTTRILTELQEFSRWSNEILSQPKPAPPTPEAEAVPPAEDTEQKATPPAANNTSPPNTAPAE